MTTSVADQKSEDNIDVIFVDEKKEVFVFVDIILIIDDLLLSKE